MKKTEEGNEFAASFSAELKGQATYWGVAVRSLASQTGESSPSVSQWLNGKAALPTRFAYSACQAIGISLVGLVELSLKRMAITQPLLMTGVLPRGDQSPKDPFVLRESGEIFADCLAAELKSQITAAGFTVWQIGDLTGRSRMGASQWLNGTRPVPLQFVHAVGGILNVGLVDIFKQAEIRMLEFENDQNSSHPPSIDGDVCEPQKESAHVQRVSRRLEALLSLHDMSPSSSYRRVSAEVSAAGESLTREEWDAALKGQLELTEGALSAIATSLGRPSGFFADPDPETTEKVESEAILARAASEAGVSRVAARGELTPAAMRKIADLVTKHIPKKE